MAKPKKTGDDRKPSTGRRKPAAKTPAADASKPSEQEEDFEHTLRRLVVMRDGLG